MFFIVSLLLVLVDHRFRLRDLLESFQLLCSIFSGFGPVALLHETLAFLILPFYPLGFLQSFVIAAKDIPVDAGPC